MQRDLSTYNGRCLLSVAAVVVGGTGSLAPTLPNSRSPRWEVAEEVTVTAAAVAVAATVAAVAASRTPFRRYKVIASNIRPAGQFHLLQPPVKAE